MATWPMRVCSPRSDGRLRENIGDTSMAAATHGVTERPTRQPSGCWRQQARVRLSSTPPSPRSRTVQACSMRARAAELDQIRAHRRPGQQAVRGLGCRIVFNPSARPRSGRLAIIRRAHPVSSIGATVGIPPGSGAYADVRDRWVKAQVRPAAAIGQPTLAGGEHASFG